MKKERKLIVISGKAGSGKSYLAAKLKQAFDRVITIDAMSEHAGLVFTDYETLKDYVLEYELWQASTFNLIFRPQDREDDSNEVEKVVKLARILGNVLLMVEEVALWEIDDQLIRIAKFDRHTGVSLMLISQRVVDLHVAVRSMSTSIIAFQTDEPADVQRLAAYGIDVEKVKNLSVGKYIFKGEAPE